MEEKLFAESGHLAHLDEREEYVTVRRQMLACMVVETGGAGRGGRGDFILS